MRLRDLDAQFVAHVPAGFRRLDSIDGAQGVMFQCPFCAVGKPIVEDEDGRGVAGAHYILLWFANPRGATRVPDAIEPAPGRWTIEGDSIETLTLHPSVHLTGPGCGWHGWVRSGDAA